MRLFQATAALAFALVSVAAAAADYPAPKEGDWIARDFKFHTGEVMPELRIHYTTVGEPTGQPVLVLHGTTGSAASMLTPAFAGELLGPGQPLDASKYYIIIPDSIGHGKSSKPSDGLRTTFPKYNYDDMVEAQYRLIKEGLGIRHLRLVIGNSMGGMHTWIWGVKHPDFMDALVPMAAQPSEMSSRNWMLRRMLIETIRSDPDYANGNYTAQPRSMKIANAFYGIATNGGTLAYQKAAPSRAEADKLVDARLAAPLRADANDFLYAVGILARLQPLARPRADRGRAARHQRGRRRAQSAGNRDHGARAQAREEGPPVADSGERADPRPRHHRHGPDLEAAAAGAPADGSAAADVGRMPANSS